MNHNSTSVKSNSNLTFSSMDLLQPTFSKTERGGEVLAVGGFDYIERKDRWLLNGQKTWRCREHKKLKCPATVKTLNGKVIEKLGWNNHSHHGDPLKPMVRQVQSDLRARASTSMESTSSIVSSSLLNVLQRLPKRSSLNDNCRAKRRATNIGPNPQDLNFEMPQKFETLTLYDSGSNDPNRMLILGNRDLLEVLENAELWQGDGTFDICPAVFYQLYTIHAKIGNSYPPCVYFLLTNKSQETYIRALEQLKLLIPNASPNTILVDFERAPINAFGQVFSTSTLKGCYFHHGQSLNRKVGELGLKTQYENNAEFNLSVKCLQALSFVPEVRVLDIFLELADTFPQDIDRVNELLSYFEVTYVRGRERANGMGRAPPSYSPGFWNHYTDVQNNIPRTTNAVEGYHTALNAIFLSKHPSLWKLLEGLEKDIVLHLKTLADDSVANNPPQRQKYKVLNQRLASKVATFENAANKMQYLRSIAHINSS